MNLFVQLTEILYLNMHTFLLSLPYTKLLWCVKRLWKACIFVSSVCLLILFDEPQEITWLATCGPRGESLRPLVYSLQPQLVTKLITLRCISISWEYTFPGLWIKVSSFILGHMSKTRRPEQSKVNYVRLLSIKRLKLS